MCVSETEESMILVYDAEHIVENIKLVNEESGLCLNLTNFCDLPSKDSNMCQMSVAPKKVHWFSAAA